MGVRRRLRCVAALWLGLQATSVAAMPFAACCDHDHDAVSELHAHCQGMTPELACPLHRQAAAVAPDTHTVSPAHQHRDGATPGDPAAMPTDSDAPALRCVCRVSVATLAAALDGRGVLQAGFVLPYDPVSAAVGLVDPAMPASTTAAETPPPRLRFPSSSLADV